MNLFDFEYYGPVYLGIFINVVLIFLLAYQGVVSFFISRKISFPYAKPLLYLCISSIAYSFSIVYAYFGILEQYMYQLSHVAMFMGVFSNTIYLNALRTYTKAPKYFKIYEYLFVGFSLICLIALWQSIFWQEDTILYRYMPSPEVPYVSLVAKYSGVGTDFCSYFFSFMGLVGAVFSINMLLHILNSTKDKWMIFGVTLNLVIALHEVAFIVSLIYYSFPLMSLSYVVEILRMTFHMQNEAARKLGKLEDEVDYLTQVARAGFAIGHICHDIRNPLSVIEGHHHRVVKMLEEPNVSVEGVLESMNKISSSSRRIQIVLNSYLSEIYRSTKPTFSEFSAKKVVEDAIEICSEKSKEAGVLDITYHGVEEDKVYGVENQLVMAFVNLLSNSCDAIKGLSEKWIRVESYQEPGSNTTVFKIIDSGSGIPENIALNIFEHSFTTKEQGKGTGLGLSFVKKVVNAHKGKIFVDHHHKHTCFVMTLPTIAATLESKIAV